MRPARVPAAFRIGDALRCALLNAPREPNLARPRSGSSGTGLPRPGGALWRNAVLQSRNRVALASWDGPRLRGLVSARTRSGHRAWEIDGLYLPGLDLTPTPQGSNGLGHNGGKAVTFSTGGDLADGAGLELLEQLVAAAGSRYAERIFLRLPVDSPALALAQGSGFTSCYAERVWEGYGRPAGNGNKPGAELWPKLPRDDYPLFQLFCASTPMKVRGALGPTFDQWRDAREPGRYGQADGRTGEWVVEAQGKVTAWLGLTGRRDAVEVETMAHPGCPELLFRAMELALARPGRQRWPVPDYQEPAADELKRHGFRPVAEYILLVKMVAVPAWRYGMAAVEA